MDSATNTRKRVLIIGAGIIGLATAREILKRRLGLAVEVVDKEANVGLHQTGRNSGVIHSGIYYKPDSLKTRLCKTGAELLNEFCDQKHVFRRKCGKLIVATEENELPELDNLYELGKQKNISGIELLEKEAIKDLVPKLRGIKAIHLPEVSLVDFKEVANAIKEDIAALGGRVRLPHHVKAIKQKNEKILVRTHRLDIETDYLINCAGLYSDQIAELAGCKLKTRIVPFRGQYYRLSRPWREDIKKLIYPVPNPQLPFLGIHLTPSVDSKRVLAGPNAVFSLAREGYEPFKINLAETLGTFCFPGFWKMASKHWRAGIEESLQSTFKGLYAKQIRKFIPSFPDKQLSFWQTAGVRAQAVDDKGNLIKDFVFLEQKNALHVLNAPSPAATAAFAIAKEIVDKMSFASQS